MAKTSNLTYNHERDYNSAAVSTKREQVSKEINANVIVRGEKTRFTKAQKQQAKKDAKHPNPNLVAAIKKSIFDTDIAKIGFNLASVTIGKDKIVL